MSDYFKGQIPIKELLEEAGATGIRSDYKDHTDPKYIGPGTWNVIHRRSYKARTHEEQVNFIDLMKDICHGFPCVVCKGHCTEYIKNHPMEEYLDILVDINGEKLALGLFVWAWKFHNAVNARIKKPIMSWDTAYNLYSETEPLVCSKNCLEAANDQPADGLQFDTKSSQEPENKVPNIPEFKITQPINNNNNNNNPIVTPFRLISINRLKH